MRKYKYNKGGGSFAEVNVYENQSDLAHAYKAAEKYWQRGDNGWRGGTAAETYGALRAGNAKYRDLIARMQSKVAVPDIDVKRKRKKRGAFGPVLNVQQLYEGNPACFVRKERVRDAGAPLTVVFDVTVSAGISTETMALRGAAVLNVVQQLSGVRPVELYVVGGMMVSGVTSMFGVRIDTQPVDIARAGWMLCSPAVLRHVWFTMCKRNAGTTNDFIRWAFDDFSWQEHNLAPAMQDYVGYKEGEYLFLGPRYLTSGDFGSEAQATQWAQDTIAKYDTRKEHVH